ncbi:MAG: TetR/AcrR family transcriptional regulator [Rhizobiales bacterium]|nr:TetR/AcrR family transcriptional regulator [Hyphomicrobiales bacterium]
MPRHEAPKALPKPLKRPSQARAKFTVQALYDTFVRIWRRDGPAAATTKAVAAEAGFAVGTVYDYFPNREALFSGYVRHSLELLLGRIDAQVIAPGGLAWEQRLSRLVRITACADPDAAYFDAAMLAREHEVAEPKHHRRFFDELTAKWTEAIRSWPDLDPQPSDLTIRTLCVAVWGSRRYVLLVAPPAEALGDWVSALERVARQALRAPSD